MDYLGRLNRIVGHDVTQATEILHFSWKDYQEGLTLLERIRRMQKELRLLKQEVSGTISAIESEFRAAHTGVSKRKVAGRNAARKDNPRRDQLDSVVPYQTIKHAIDRTIVQLDSVKGQIELSPQCQVRGGRTDSPRYPTSAPPVPPARFFVYVQEVVKGPYTSEQLAALYDLQSISEDTLCCSEGTENWQRYFDILV